MMGSWPWRGGGRESGEAEDAGGHDDGLSCTREIRTIFSWFATKIVADGGRLKTGRFTRWQARELSRFRECCSEHVLICTYIKHHARIMNKYGRRKYVRLSRSVDRV